MKRLRHPLVVLAFSLTTWVALAQQRAPVVSSSTLVDAAGNGAEWLTYGHDYAETHFSPLTQINTRNVKRLSLAWSMATDAPQGVTEATLLPTRRHSPRCRAGFS